MRFTATKPAKRVALVAALGVGMLSATGCGYINAQQTTHTYSASDGIRADIALGSDANSGAVQLRNMLIVSNGTAGSGSSASADAPGRLVGTIFNTSDQSQTVTVNDGANTIRLDVPKHGEVQLDKPGTPVNLAKAGAVPGALATVSFTAGGTKQDVQIPVVDGTLSEYRQYIPTPSATSSATPSGNASGTATSSASATPSH